MLFLYYRDFRLKFRLLNGGNEGPRDKAGLVPAATSEWTESPLCMGAPCPPSLTLTGHANKQLIEPGEGPRETTMSPSRPW